MPLPWLPSTGAFFCRCSRTANARSNRSGLLWIAANSWKLWRRNFKQAMRGVNSPTLPTRLGYRSDSRQHLNLSGGLKVDPDPRQTPPAGAGPMPGPNCRPSPAVPDLGARIQPSLVPSLPGPGSKQAFSINLDRMAGAIGIREGHDAVRHRPR